MSSDSEDEFQSADEGSDFEDSNPAPCPSVMTETNTKSQEPSNVIKPQKMTLLDADLDADDESEEESPKEPEPKTFDDKVTNLMSALDQLSVKVNKQLGSSVSKQQTKEPRVEEDSEGEEHIEQWRINEEIKEEEKTKREEEEKERKLKEEEEERERKYKEDEEERERKLKEDERKRELEREEQRMRELEREEERKRELEREEERERELEREEERKREKERKKALEREEERKRELRREEEQKRELEGEEERKKELERKEKNREEERKQELERKRQMREQEKKEIEQGKEAERKIEVEKVSGGQAEDQEMLSQKTKPIRESKIGMKKPREKLGERLGARKLGAKVEKKPMESISSDSYIKQNENDSQSENQSEALEAQRREEARLQEEKRRKQQQWEEQQKRWQQINNMQDQTETASKQEEDTSWGGGWGGWGTSLLSAASTFTREVGRGVGTVMETVESSLGAPDPELLAKEIAERDKELQKIQKHTDEKKSKENTPEEEQAGEEPSQDYTASCPSNQQEESTGYIQGYSLGGLSSLGSLVSGVSGALETASSKVLLGGLDTLEVIGRKAMTVIQEGDPGLRKKRAFLTNRKPNLSMVLQDARQRAAQEEADQRDGIDNNSGLSQRPNFDQAWENTEGPVHLEALSLVAKQCESKMNSLLQSMPPYLVDRIQNSNLEIKKICEVDEESHLEGDFATIVTKIISQIRLPLHSQKIKEAWTSVEEKVSIVEEKKQLDWLALEKEIYLSLASVISQLAAVTHKGSELALITAGSDPTAIATSFKELSSVVCAGIENTVDQICSNITAKASAADPEVNNTITNIYLQGASGNNYVQEGMTFLSSVLQYANTKFLAADL